MKTDEAKQIPITDLLAKLNHNPTKQKGDTRLGITLLFMTKERLPSRWIRTRTCGMTSPYPREVPSSI